MADLDLSQAITSAVTQAISTVLGESSRSMADPGPRQPNGVPVAGSYVAFTFLALLNVRFPLSQN